MQSKRFDWKIDLPLVAALFLSAGTGIAFVFYRPEAPQSDNRKAVSESQNAVAPVQQPVTVLPEQGPGPDNRPSDESSNTTDKGNETDAPPSPEVQSPPSASPRKSKAAASQPRSPKAQPAKSVSKKPGTQQVPMKTVSPTKKTSKKK